MAYLVTGRWYFMEEAQFSATIGFLKQTDQARQFAKGLLRTDVGANTTRGAKLLWRDIEWHDIGLAGLGIRFTLIEKGIFGFFWEDHERTFQG